MSNAVRISPQEAANSAVKYMSGLVPLRDVPSVEEVEYSEEANEWLITLGYVPVDANPIGYAMGQRNRDYKIFRINAETGDILSMKIRKIS